MSTNVEERAYTAVVARPTPVTLRWDDSEIIALLTTVLKQYETRFGAMDLGLRPSDTPQGS